MLLLGLLVVSFPDGVMASNYKPVMYVTSDNSQVLEGNRVEMELVVNTLGNKVSKINAVVAVSGAIRANGVTYNMHPLHEQRLHDSSGLKLENYSTKELSGNSVQSELELRAIDSSGFNEGSAAISKGVADQLYSYHRSEGSVFDEVRSIDELLELTINKLDFVKTKRNKDRDYLG